jgi:hypothetical protein
MANNKLVVLCVTSAVAALLFGRPTFAGVVVDMTPKEVDAIKGTIRVRDLAVNDTAQVFSGQLCIRNGKLFLPNSLARLDGPKSEWRIDLKITILPGNKVRAATVLPDTSDKARIKDSIEGFLNSVWTPAAPSFPAESPYCDKRKKEDFTRTVIEYLEVESIDGMHSLKQVYEALLSEADK